MNIEQLEQKTRVELIEMCRARNIVGMTKKPKDILIHTLSQFFKKEPEMSVSTLMEKTVAELRQIAANMGITGVSKKRKDEIISKITKAEEGTDEVVACEAFIQSELTRPDLNKDRTTTKVTISCGATTGKFDVANKKVGQVAILMKEIFNVSSVSQGVVNGNPVSDDYVLKSGDVLEFVKSAGGKG